MNAERRVPFSAIHRFMSVADNLMRLTATNSTAKRSLNSANATER